MSKIRSVFCAAFAALAFTSFAIDYTTYTWTGKAGDGQWTTAGNWTKDSGPAEGGYPNAQNTFAVFNGTATVNVSSDVTVKLVRVTKGTLDLTASDGVKLTFPNGHDGSQFGGYDVLGDATLNLRAPSYYTSRFDMLGNGTINYYSTISGQQKDFYIHALVNNFRKGFVLNGNVFLAMGSMGNAYQFNLLDDAKIYSGGATISIAKGSSGTTIGYTVQDGDETEVITTANLAITQDGTSQPQHYTLKRGLLRVKDPNGVNGILLVGYNTGGGSFTQEGGTSELTRLEPTYGNAYLKGGTMTVYKEILYRDNHGAIFEMSGGTLNLDAGCTVSSPFTVSGGTVKFAPGTTVSQPITFTGGVAEIPAGVVFSGDGKIVMNGGAVGVPADCTWTELQASLPTGKVEGTDIRFYGDNGQTVTFESGDVAPQAFNGVGDIRVVVEDMSSLANCTAIRASEVTLPDGGLLENQDLALTAGTKTYAEAIALNPKSLEVDGATILLNEGTDVKTTIDRPVKLTSGSFEYNGKRLAYGENGKFIFNGGALKFPGGSGDIYTLSVLLDYVPHEGDRLNFTTAAAGTTFKILAGTFTLPASLEIGSAVTLEVQANAQLIAASATPPALIVRNGGKVNIANQSAYIAAPIDLTIDQGGQLQVDAGGSGQYARTAIVAHSYTAWGVKKGVGKYETVKVATDPTAPFASVQGTASYIFVPYTWTGAGDGKSIGETANWENGQVSLSSTSVVMDFSRATGPVEVGAACQAWGVAYLPPEGGPDTLRIGNAEGSTAKFSIVDNKQYGASSICRKGCTIEFNVDVAGGTSQQVNWIGKGTYRFLKTLTQCHPDYFVLDGAVEIGGQLMTSNGNLCFCEDHHSESRMTFIDGAAVTLAGVITIDHGDGFTSGNGYYQTGGSVQAVKLCLTRALRDQEGASRYAYRLSDGTLTLTDSLILGGPHPFSPGKAVCSGGIFEMTGGTLTTPIILHENNNQFLHLFGGDVYLGAGGFTKTTSTRKETVPQSEASIVINGATLHATDDSWSVSEELTVELRGPAGFAVAAEKEVVITGAVSGVGGIVKTGEGTLTIKGGYAATGSVTVSAGSLVLENVAEGLSLDALTLENGGALALPEGAVITVNRFVINGVYQPGGRDYTCGQGTVRVAEGSVGWIGPSGGKWSESANWAGEVLPTADDAVYFPSALTTAEGGLTIEIDGAAAAGKLVLEAGTLAFTGDGALTLADSTEIAVAEGAELTFGPQVYAALRVSKTGKGLVTFNGGLRSLDDPATLVWPATNQLKVVQGEAKIACEVAGLRLFACSAVEADMPRVTLEEGAIATDRCWVQGPWAGLSATGYGEVVMNGGTADMQSGSSIFGDNGAGAPSLASDKFPIAFFKTGKAKFTLNGGTFRVHARFLPNLSNTNDNGGEVLVTIDGGELYVGTAYYLGTQNNEVDMLVLESGKIDVGLFAAGSGKGKKFLRFNGGELAMHRSTITFTDPSLKSFVSGIEKNCWVSGELKAGSDFEPVEIGGPVKFTQLDKDIDSLFGPQVIFKEGAELLDQEGPGTVSFLCVPEGDFAVKITNGGKVGLRFGTGTVKEVESVTVGSRMRVAGDYGESGRLPSRFPGGGIFRAMTGGDAQGMTIQVR